MPGLSLPDNAYAAALTALDGIGSRTLCALGKSFGIAQAIWEASFDDLTKVIPERPARLLAAQRERLDLVALWHDIERRGLVLVRLNDDGYPALLREISDPPFLLYLHGNTAVLKSRCLSVVGTRRATAYGRAVAHAVVPPLAASGFVIVSGLALGIDSLAHEAALTKGKTIAVLAHGLDQIHPASNTRLAETIVSGGGALISEYPPGTPPARGRFPQRNRIIAGLSRQTLIIEAPERSGALITAHLALDENREVLAVPGSVFSATSAGTNRLIHDGATVVRSAEDIIGPSAQTVLPLDETTLSTAGRQICQALVDGPLHIDNIAAACNLDPSTVGAELAYLELAGIVMNLGSQRYQRRR